jgi:O-antigen biosynthesis protein
MPKTAASQAALKPGAKSSSVPAFYIACPTYTEFSSGVRCLYILCHHLNQLGYKAFVTGRGAPPHLNAPHIGQPLIALNRQSGVDDVVIYPEVIAGNPLGGRKIVRYLLNKPGFFNSFGASEHGSFVQFDHGLGMAGYGPDDFFMHFAEEFHPDGVDSFHLPLPLVDPGIFRRADPQPDRKGYVLYSNRHRVVPSELPAWVTPYTIASMSEPRSAAQMAALYQSHVALAIWERSAAGSEAVQCGCPVIVIPNSEFQPEPIMQRYRDNGFVVGWDQAGLQRAQQTVSIAARLYWHRFRKLDRKIHEFVWRVSEYFAKHPQH